MENTKIMKDNTQFYSNLFQKSILLGTLLIATFSLFGQKKSVYKGTPPRSEINTPQELKIVLEKYTIKALVAKEYFMSSNDSYAGNSYNARLDSVTSKVQQFLNEFALERTMEYQQVVHEFYNSYERSSIERYRKDCRLWITEDYEFLPNTIEYTKNGDMKKKPKIVGRKISWTMGGESGTFKTFVKINGIYSTSFITKQVENEVYELKKAFSEAKIPVD